MAGRLGRRLMEVLWHTEDGQAKNVQRLLV